MSRQAVTQQTPPLFLNQAQYNQLQRSFTDPLQRRITALEADVEYWRTTAETFDQTIQGYEEQAQEYRDTINAQQATINQLRGNQWPDTDEQVTQDRSFYTNVILWFSFNGGSSATYILRYTNIESQTYGYLEIPSGTESALVIFNRNTNRINYYIDGALSTDLADVTEPRVEYNATSNNRIRAFY